VNCPHKVGGIGRHRQTAQFAWIAFTISPPVALELHEILSLSSFPVFDLWISLVSLAVLSRVVSKALLPVLAHYQMKSVARLARG